MRNFKVGDVIKVIRMDDANGADILSRKMNGAIGTIVHIDDIGQLQLKEHKLAVIPEIDDVEVIN